MPKPRVGYILKRYPRLSETFILDEILAHEAAGLELEILSLRQPSEECRHEDVDKVRAPVTYLEQEVRMRPEEFGRLLAWAGEQLGDELGLLTEEHPKEPWRIVKTAMVADVIAKRGITHLHAHFATDATTVARSAAKIAKIPYSFTAHAKDIYHNTVEDEHLAMCIRDACAVVTVSDYNIRYLCERLGLSGERMHRIYNGLDLEAFPYQEHGREANHVLAVGRLVEKKGFCDLVSACAVLRDRGREFRCSIVGDGDLYDALRQQIDSLGLGDIVTMTGPQPRERVREEMRSAGLLAAPCVIGEDGNRDGLPTVLLEAMASGLPCVSTDVTGIPEAIEDGRTGLLVPGHDPESLADAIQRLIDDRALAASLAQEARAKVEHTFSRVLNTERLRAIFGHSALAETAR